MSIVSMIWKVMPKLCFFKIWRIQTSMLKISRPEIAIICLGQNGPEGISEEALRTLKQRNSTLPRCGGLLCPTHVDLPANARAAPAHEAEAQQEAKH